MLGNAIDTTLAELGCNRTLAAGSPWGLHIPGLLDAQASLQGNCLTFLSPPIPPESPWTTATQNSGLGPGLRLILDRTGQRRLVGETLLLSGDRLKISEGIRVLFDLFANGASRVLGDPKGNSPAALPLTPLMSLNLTVLAEELDRPAQEHGSELLLDCGTGERTQKIRVRSDTTGLVAWLPLLTSGFLSQESLNALSLLFLRMSSSYRMVRAAATRADGIAFNFEIALLPSALAEEVDAALDCLSFLAGSCLDEAGLLQQEDAAKNYLAVSDGAMVNPEQKGGESCD